MEIDILLARQTYGAETSLIVSMLQDGPVKHHSSADPGKTQPKVHAGGADFLVKQFLGMRPVPEAGARQRHF